MHTQVGLPQPIRQHFLLGSNLCAKRCSDSFMEHEQLVDGHRIKVALLRASLLHAKVPFNDRAIMNIKHRRRNAKGSGCSVGGHRIYTEFPKVILEA